MARVYKYSAIYDARIAGMRNLWEPSKEYMGKPVETPNYLATVVMKKTRANWYEEPAMAAFAQSCKELYDAALSHIPFQYVVWPVQDGDVPQVGKTTVADWRAGHWVLNGSSTSPIEVSIVQNGVPVPLTRRAEVKSGDHVSVTTSVAVKTNDPRGVKCYINKVMFTGPGEEIVIGNSISNADLMAQAKAQGLNVTGFGGGAPQQGFGPQGFTAPPASGPAPFPGNGPQTGFAPPPVQPPAQQGFASPQNFSAPTGFPPRQ